MLRSFHPVTITIEHDEAHVLVEELSSGRKLVKVVPTKEGLFIPCSEWETKYPLELIRLVLEVKGAAYLCDELRRDEDPEYLQLQLNRDLFAYFEPQDFKHKRALDFGCGSGASTVTLARLFPDTEIVGVELREDLLSVARKRAEFYRLSNIKLLSSPAGTELPSNLGQFDFVIMSAVYEHLLPVERKILMPKIWRAILEGGRLFINQTPNRMSPVEFHTTGLPLLNYLPKPLALRASHKFSKRIEQTDSWEILLRKGIRGATEREIINNLNHDAAYSPRIIEPDKRGFQDRVDLWYSALNPDRMRLLKRMA
ncbi:MAG: class I SAM-dependent methyltransferase, partial [Acidobacteria bacterium]|nr:class I SAM-dependent methyltransferase [Acidobacteriota bacterium]